MCESIKIYFVDPDWLYLHIQHIMHIIYAHVWTVFILSHGKKVCCCHWASCGSFLLGWHAGVVLCHRATWDIMWAYQVATWVSGSMWVTEGLLILERYHFLPLFSHSGGWAFLKMVGFLYWTICRHIKEEYTQKFIMLN